LCQRQVLNILFQKIVPFESFIQISQSRLNGGVSLTFKLAFIYENIYGLKYKKTFDVSLIPALSKDNCLLIKSDGEAQEICLP
jgi:hypothetical protein